MSKSLLLVIGLLLVQGSVLVLAQTNNPPSPGPTTPGTGGMALLLTLIPLVVPILVATAKYFVGKMPSFLLPVLATALGALLNWILVLTNQPHTTVLNAAVLGAAGIGVRELYDQLKGTIITQAPALVEPPNTP